MANQQVTTPVRSLEQGDPVSPLEEGAPVPPTSPKRVPLPPTNVAFASKYVIQL